MKNKEKVTVKEVGMKKSLPKKDVSVNFYKVIFKPSAIIPDIEIR